MLCSRCGTAIGVDSTTCMSCGAEIPSDAANPGNGPYESAELSKEGRSTMSASAVVRLLIGVVFMAIGFSILGAAVDVDESAILSTIFELFSLLIGLAFIAPGLLLIFSSLFGIKKSGEADLPVESDNAESPAMKFAKGCGVVMLIILVGLVGLVALLSAL